MNKPHAHIYSAEINTWIAGTLKLPTYLWPRSPHRAGFLPVGFIFSSSIVTIMTISITQPQNKRGTETLVSMTSHFQKAPKYADTIYYLAKSPSPLNQTITNTPSIKSGELEDHVACSCMKCTWLRLTYTDSRSGYFTNGNDLKLPNVQQSC